ncbi:uncharacterized protein BDV17DRAFT_293242 [Aspergillus undulatus]|uniref:uncharacterized protein n=1 Tax=Aspergillus undulatus TaxID=1810928 RepID=UPI003CCD97F9
MAIANAVFLNQCLTNIPKILPDVPKERIEAAVQGTNCLLDSLSDELQVQVLEAIVSGISKTYILVVAAGALVVVLSLLMKRERLSNVSAATTHSQPCASQSRQNEKGHCQCRADLMAQVPEIKDTMQRTPPQLDQILNVTFEVLFVCRNLIVCTNCQISYADLVCAVAALQQTETCFEHIVEQGMLNDSSAI